MPTPGGRFMPTPDRAWKDRAIDVAQRGVDGAVGIDDGQRAAMEGLDQSAAQGFGQDGVG